MLKFRSRDEHATCGVFQVNFPSKIRAKQVHAGMVLLALSS